MNDFVKNIANRLTGNKTLVQLPQERALRVRACATNVYDKIPSYAGFYAGNDNDKQNWLSVNRD
ncbi:MAG: hypothetical protein CMH30_04870 [Micavibrio sp.]|nr:hypothetical protein [Micavibrio sp.]|tara:strand:+ start:772 stop:963 length:192 start_codon:yes stop_codon:yes gene_type:complete